jgi:hypothetical protein
MSGTEPISFARNYATMLQSSEAAEKADRSLAAILPAKFPNVARSRRSPPVVG